MTYWPSMGRVVVPQAVRRMTPAIVSQLVAIVFILVCLLLSRTANRLESRQRRRFGASSVKSKGVPRT